MDELPRGYGQGKNLIENVKKPTEPSTIRTPIRCPVVIQYQRRGREATIERPKPNPFVSVEYDPKLTLKTLEKHYIAKAIQYFNGNLSQAARALGIGKATIYKKIKNEAK